MRRINSFQNACGFSHFLLLDRWRSSLLNLVLFDDVSCKLLSSNSFSATLWPQGKNENVKRGNIHLRPTSFHVDRVLQHQAVTGIGRGLVVVYCFSYSIVQNMLSSPLIHGERQDRFTTYISAKATVSSYEFFFINELPTWVNSFLDPSAQKTQHFFFLQLFSYPTSGHSGLLPM